LRIEGKKEEKVHLAGKCIFKGIKKKKSLLTGEGRLALFDSANPTFTSNYPPPSPSLTVHAYMTRFIRQG
jgi:hypothetical protein